MSPTSSSSSPPDTPAVATAQPAPRSRFWQRAPRLVVPREASIYFRLPCENVPFYQLASFAQLQARLHAPFVRYGSSAVKQGQHLHLWIWDRALEDRFEQNHPGVKGFSAIAQSLLSQPVSDGVVWVSSGSGTEAQLWRHKQLQDAQWFDVPPGPQAWQQRQAETPGLLGLGWPLHLPPVDSSIGKNAQRPWARNLTPRTQPVRSINIQQIAWPLLGLVALLLLGWAAWLLGQQHGFNRLIHDSQNQQQLRLSQGDPNRAARTTTRQLQQHIQTLQALNAGPQPRAVIDALATLLARQGLWLRDINILGGTVEATIVTPPGITPRLTAMVGAIDSQPQFYDARFVDVVPGGGFKFSWRLQAAASPSPNTP